MEVVMVISAALYILCYSMLVEKFSNEKSLSRNILHRNVN